ncbi:neck protein [Serratia phage 4S]|nr:neck protein [Serratia phage 4S]
MKNYEYPYDENLFASLDNGTGYAATYDHEILNPYVNWNDYKPTQMLQDSLVAESIQMKGIELYFIPRQFVKPDMIFGEDLENKFDKAWKIAAYLNTFDSYEGQGDFFSKFGYTANDEATFSINPRLFKHQTEGQDPISGDLLYYPRDRTLLEITWVQPYDPFYQVGKNAIRKLICQKFIYSGEEIKPVLNRPEGINIPEFADLDLEPVHNLSDLADINEEQFAEDIQIAKEAKEYVFKSEVVNGRGNNTDQPPIISPFDSEFSSEF